MKCCGGHGVEPRPVQQQRDGLGDGLAPRGKRQTLQMNPECCVAKAYTVDGDI